MGNMKHIHPFLIISYLFFNDSLIYLIKELVTFFSIYEETNRYKPSINMTLFYCKKIFDFFF